MAQFNSIHSNIWEDEKFLHLASSDPKLLFIYLFSNHRCPVSGIYKISLKTMSNETGIEACEATLQEVIDVGLVKYDFEKNVVWVRGKIKHDKSWTTKMRTKSIKSNLDEFVHCSFMRYVFEQYSFLKDLAIEAEQERKRIQGSKEPEGEQALEEEKATEIEKDGSSEGL